MKVAIGSYLSEYGSLGNTLTQDMNAQEWYTVRGNQHLDTYDNILEAENSNRATC